MVAQNLSVVFCVNIMWPRDSSDKKLAEIFGENGSTNIQEVPQMLERVLTIMISRCEEIFSGASASAGGGHALGVVNVSAFKVVDEGDGIGPYSSVSIKPWRIEGNPTPL